ncbi:MAG: RNA polymerase sigma factor [Pyrinomonadaceae bacterium]
MSQRLALDLAGDLAGNLAGVDRRPGSHSGSLMNSSEDLITRARAGDQEAFRLIFERYARPMLSFIYDLVGQRDLAEDLAQETFVRAYKSLKQIRDETKLASWLFGIGRNVAREAIRSRQRESKNLFDADLSACAVEDTTQTNPAQDLLQKELNGAMHNALNALDEDWRLIFVLKVFHQCSYHEIAEITGFSVPKVKTDLHRARLEIRRRIRPLL